MGFIFEKKIRNKGIGIRLPLDINLLLQNTLNTKQKNKLKRQNYEIQIYFNNSFSYNIN